MNDDRKIDEFGREIRKCAYCGDEFVATHKLRQFCPEKYGRTDYCKYKQKALIAESHLVQEPLNMIKGGVVPPSKQESHLAKNIRILDKIMNDSNSKLVSPNELSFYGYDIYEFNERHKISDNEQYVIKVGDYCMKLQTENKLLITKV